MKNKGFKRLTSAALVLVLILSVFPTVFAADQTEFATREYVVSEFVQSVGRNNLTGSDYILSTFSDSDQIDEEYADDISKAATAGIVRGYEDRTLRPKENVQRIEAMVMLARCLENTDEIQPVQDPIAFTDTPDWAVDDINKLSAAGLIQGYGDGTMGAEDNITVEQVKLLTDRSDAALNTVEPGESFYGYVNNKAFRNADLSSSTTIDAKHGAIITQENAWSHFTDIYNDVTEKENDLLVQLVEGDLEYEQGSAAQRIYDMLMCIDGKFEDNPEDTELFESYRSMITEADTIDEFVAAVNTIYKETGINLLFSISAVQNSETGKMEPGIAFASMGSGGLISYSSSATEQYGDEYKDLIGEYLDSIGYTASDSDIEKAYEIQGTTSTGMDLIYVVQYVYGLMTRAIIDPDFDEETSNAMLETLIAEHPELNALEENATATAAPQEVYSLEEANEMIDNIDISSMLSDVGFYNIESVIPSLTGNLEACEDVLTASNLEALKINALLQYGLSIKAGSTQEELDKLNELENLGAAVVTGLDPDRYAELYAAFTEQQVQEAAESSATTDETDETEAMDPETARILSAANMQELQNLMPMDIGYLYCEYYYDESTTAVIQQMVDDIKAAYIERFENNDWMAEETKQNAINKVNKIRATIGYSEEQLFPDIIPVSEGGTYFTNTLRIKQNDLRSVIAQCGDENYIYDIMLMSPDIQNAYYNPSLNNICILAGILNAPIYDKDASYAANLGAIGAVIAHEIGHAFDANGAQYDENGVLSNWWTEEDAAIFQEKQQEFVDYYSRFEVIDGVTQDSLVTITENMADVAGIQCVFDIIGDDRTAQQEALESFATMWAQIGTSNYLTSEQLLQDVHSSNQVRVNACVTTIDAFYEIYDIQEGDPMYVAPEDRLKLW